MAQNQTKLSAENASLSPAQVDDLFQRMAAQRVAAMGIGGSD
ncbi:hypothetical protein [Mesorhizobium sp.]|nr:hypothetical protein [Mesorhizobium sp.]